MAKAGFPLQKMSAMPLSSSTWRIQRRSLAGYVAQVTVVRSERQIDHAHFVGSEVFEERPDRRDDDRLGALVEVVDAPRVNSIECEVEPAVRGRVVVLHVDDEERGAAPDQLNRLDEGALQIEKACIRHLRRLLHARDPGVVRPGTS